MAQAWLWWRLLKFLGLAFFAFGLGGAVLARAQSRRLWSVHVPATLGLFLTWIAGYGLTKVTGVSIREPWILVSLATGLLALHEAAAVAQRDRVHPIHVALLTGAFTTAISSMVVRNAAEIFHLAVFGFPLGLALVTFLVARAAEDSHDYEPRVVPERTRTWFVWVARAEGISLVLLLFLDMPLRKGLGIALDGGQGWFGWVHGVMVLIYLQALWSAFRVLGWSIPRAGLAFFASLLPFGTFIFEAKVLRKPDLASPA